MKKLKFIIGMTLVLMLTAGSAFGLKYGNELINVGDLKSKVRIICGEPVSKEVIGYIDQVELEKRIRVMKIEEWGIEVKNYNSTYYYSLVFEGNVLKEITDVGEKK